MDNLTLKVIARIYTDFGEKFGVPRQSGLVPELTGINGHRLCVRQGWEATKKRVFLPHVLLSDRIR